MCDFCENGKFKSVDGYDTSGLRSMRSMLAEMIGKDENGISVDFEEGEYFLTFDNSSGEYAKGAVEVAFCPMCGRKLSEEMEKPSVDEILAELKNKLTEDDYEKLNDSIKSFSDGIGGLWEVLRKGIENGD